MVSHSWFQGPFWDAYFAHVQLGRFALNQQVANKLWQEYVDGGS